MKRAKVVVLVLWITALLIWTAVGIKWLHENQWHDEPPATTQEP
ncbi:hypothetical protein LCGC14_0513920 [marine sediment metagenome]|uniref:Uncharacterized protein n=1 Tax=marine sediment metagenome TaxID=412755 RepID=A0A0F9S0H0_9ZZZZ